MAAFKSFSYNFSIPVILVLASVDCLFKIQIVVVFILGMVVGF
jgi:hypothetical protein